MRWRKRRLTRLRTTAPPTALLTTKPARVEGSISPARAGPLHRLYVGVRQGAGDQPDGPDVLRSRSPRAASADSRETARRHDPPVSYAERAARPLPRRFARMARPARVRIRRRKPWVLARRRLFGWKVRLLTRGLQRINRCGGTSPGCHRAPTRRKLACTPEWHRKTITISDLRPSVGRRQQPSTTRPRYGTRGYAIRSNRVGWAPHCAQAVDNDLNRTRWPDYR